MSATVGNWPARRTGILIVPSRFTTNGQAEHRPSNASRLTRDQVVDRIISLNPTASRGFLEDFGDERLTRYLDHLTEAQKPRGREARWRRPGDAPPIMRRDTRR